MVLQQQLGCNMDTQETMRPMGGLKRRISRERAHCFFARLGRMCGGQSLAKGYLSPSVPLTEVAAALWMVCLRRNWLQAVGEGAE